MKKLVPVSLILTLVSLCIANGASAAIIPLSAQCIDSTKQYRLEWTFATRSESNKRAAVSIYKLADNSEHWKATAPLEVNASASNVRLTGAVLNPMYYRWNYSIQFASGAKTARGSLKFNETTKPLRDEELQFNCELELPGVESQFVDAACKGDLAQLELFYQMRKLNVNEVVDGETALTCAIKNGHKAAAMSLLQQTDFPINTAIRNSDGNSAWHLAIKEDQAELIENLFKKHSGEYDPSPDADGNPPHFFIRSSKAMSSFILSDVFTKVDLNAKNKSGTTFVLAMFRNAEGLALALLKAAPNRIDTNVVDEEGKTLLHDALSPEFIAVLLEDSKTDPNIKDKFGRTPMWYWAKRACIKKRDKKDHMKWVTDLVQSDGRFVVPKENELDVTGSNLLFFVLDEYNELSYPDFKILLELVGLKEPNRLNAQGQTLLQLLVSRLLRPIIREDLIEGELITILEDLISSYGIDPFVKDDYGRNLNHYFDHFVWQNTAFAKKYHLVDIKTVDKIFKSQDLNQVLALAQDSNFGPNPAMLFNYPLDTLEHFVLSASHLPTKALAAYMLRFAEENRWELVGKLLSSRTDWSTAENAICPEASYKDRSRYDREFKEDTWAGTSTRVLCSDNGRNAKDMRMNSQIPVFSQIMYLALEGQQHAVLSQLARLFPSLGKSSLVYRWNYSPKVIPLFFHAFLTSHYIDDRIDIEKLKFYLKHFPDSSNIACTHRKLEGKWNRHLYNEFWTYEPCYGVVLRILSELKPDFSFNSQWKWEQINKNVIDLFFDASFNPNVVTDVTVEREFGSPRLLRYHYHPFYLALVFDNGALVENLLARPDLDLSTAGPFTSLCGYLDDCWKNEFSTFPSLWAIIIATSTGSHSVNRVFETLAKRPDIKKEDGVYCRKAGGGGTDVETILKNLGFNVSSLGRSDPKNPDRECYKISQPR